MLGIIFNFSYSWYNALLSSYVDKRDSTESYVATLDFPLYRKNNGCLAIPYSFGMT